MQQAQLVIQPGMQAQQLLRLLVAELDPPSQHAQHEPRRLMECPIKVRHKGAEARQDGFRQPDVRLLAVLLGADFKAFLSGRKGSFRGRCGEKRGGKRADVVGEQEDDDG